MARAESDIELMEKDLEEHRRRDEEISQLLQSEDNAHFLQVRMNAVCWLQREGSLLHYYISLFMERH